MEPQVFLAQKLYDTGDPRAALAQLADLPVSPAHQYLAGLCHHALGDLAAAYRLFETVAEQQPEFSDAHRNLGIIDQDQNRPLDAAARFCRVLEIDSTDVLTRKNLYTLLMEFDWAAVRETDLVEILCARLAEGFLTAESDFGRYLPAVIGALGQLSAFRAACASLAQIAAEVHVDPLIGHEWFGALARTPLLQELLKFELVPVAGFEAVMSMMRREMLRVVVNDQHQIPALDVPFCAALAQQTFLNEYVYECLEDECEWLETLHNHIVTKDAPDRYEIVRLIIFSAYRPLGEVEQYIAADQLVSELQSVWRVQVEASSVEADLAGKIETLALSGNPISLQVKSQYEENPFPRWTVFQEPVPQSVSAFLAAQYSGLNLPERFQGSCSILIPGCGTGHQAIVEAQRHPDAVITAIDLSRTSLAYAVRMAEYYNVSNIQFLEGDILEIDRLDTIFDVIECTGVLHHMDDPLVGWQNLVARLRPDGMMKVALYSGRARRHIHDVRRWIEKMALAPTVENIRKVRSMIHDLPDDDPRRSVMEFSDFYSISGVRDLLFHVREVGLSPTDIGSMLDALRLEMVGLQLGTPEAERYDAMFPDDTNRSDLANWEKFEQKFPDSFKSMFIFWCRMAG